MSRDPLCFSYSISNYIEDVRETADYVNAREVAPTSSWWSTMTGGLLALPSIKETNHTNRPAFFVASQDNQLLACVQSKRYDIFLVLSDNFLLLKIVPPTELFLSQPKKRLKSLPVIY